MADFPALDLRWRSSPESAPLDALVELLHASLDQFEPQAIHDHDSADGWRVFFKTPRQRDEAVIALERAFADRLSAVSAIDVADEEWARRSQANLTAIRVGRIIVAPPWDSPAHTDDSTSDILIVIDPSTGFGTGHHETTRLCLTLLQSVTLTARRVIDVGTGSGVLAIAAAKLGASSVVAFDEDPEALRNARENIARNDVASAVEARESDLAAFTSGSAGVVLANLTAAVIEKHADRLSGLLEPGGVLIVSGFSSAEADGIARALGRRPECEKAEGDWAAALFRY